MSNLLKGVIMTALNAITPFNFNGSDVRVIMRNGNPWFVATDVCAALDYSNTSKAVADHLDEDERSNEQLDRSRMGSKAVIISESGLYALVLRSRKPEARKFAKWVTAEVLPAIRKTGSYGQPEQLTLNQRLDRYAQQIDEGNGAPLVMFMPLWAAINRRMMENIAPSAFQLVNSMQVDRRLAH
jgi:prophage antirepressor-like protein